jgi:hypothetical protein
VPLVKAVLKMHLTRVGVLEPLVAVAASSAQTRRGEIEAWRDENAVRSHPEACSSPESKLVPLNEFTARASGCPQIGSAPSSVLPASRGAPPLWAASERGSEG